jgi:hypothetical protein
MKPPKHLAATERRLFADTVREFSIDDAPGLCLLMQACEAHQLARECREIVARDGLMVDGKAHVLLVTLRDARKAFAVLMRQLELDVEPKKPIGRPPLNA